MTTPVTRCRRSGCNRPLRSAASIARGYSLRCERLERADRKREALESALRIATAPYSDRQVDDANALIAAGKLRPLSRPGLWQSKSRDGKRVYILSALSCPCASPGPCCHMCAVAMVETYEAYQEVA